MVLGIFDSHWVIFWKKMCTIPQIFPDWSSVLSKLLTLWYCVKVKQRYHVHSCVLSFCIILEAYLGSRYTIIYITFPPF